MWPDFIKILVEGVQVERLLHHPLLDFQCNYSDTTSEINDKRRVSRYRFGQITIYKSKNGTHNVIFTGSVHKLWNDLMEVESPDRNKKKIYSGFNGNQFTLDALNMVKDDLIRLFDCPPDKMILQNIEFGMNVFIPFDPKLFIKGLLFHNGKMFEFKHNGNYAQVEHQQYFVKIYNKSEQCGMDQHVLRVELKFIKMAALKAVGIFTMDDLEIVKLSLMFDRLSECLREIVYYDYTLDKNGFTAQMRVTADNYSNPRYWYIDLPPNRRDRHKRKLKEFIATYSENLKEVILQKMYSHWVIINRLKNGQGVINNRLNIGLPITHSQSTEPDRKCNVTGLTITMQQAHSSHLSHSGLYYFHRFDFAVFQKIRSQFLSAKWVNAPLKIQIKEIAHNIRNAASNRRIKIRRLYPLDQVRLFE